MPKETARRTAAAPARAPVAFRPGMQLLLMDRGAIAASYPIGPEPITLGRDPDNSICLLDDRASRKHAVVSVRDGGVVVEDLDSSNGTWVNERRVSKQPLRPGDVLRAAGTVLVFALPRTEAAPRGWIVARTLTGGEIALPLAERSLIIGRAEQADIRFPDAGLTECHAVVVAQSPSAGEGHTVELVLLAAPRLRRVPLPDGVEVPVGALMVKFQTQPPAAPAGQEAQSATGARHVSGEVSAQEDAVPLQEAPPAPTPPPAPARPRKKPHEPKKNEPSVVLTRECGDATLMGAIAREVERVDSEFAATPRPPRTAPTVVGTGEPATRAMIEVESEGLKVTITRGKRLGETFLLGPNVFTIGRDAICDLRLDDPPVAQQHAWIRLHGPKAILEDLGSPAGTLVNGHRTRRHTVTPGDTIRIGETEMLVHL